MGLLDMFGGGKGAFKKHAGRAANKRAQAPDRWDSLRALSQMGSPEAVSALLERFTFKVDPSITDQDEKDLALDGIVRAGDEAVAPTISFLKRAESVSWPMKALEKLVSEDRVVEVLLEVLGEMDTEYERDPERKIQVVSFLAERQDPRIPPAMVRFLDDMDETVRFLAVGCLSEQSKEDAETARDALVELLAKEESVRVRERVLDALVEHGWKLSSKEVDAIRPQLPTGWAIDPKGHLRRRR